MSGKLFFKVLKRIERMAGIEPFLILTVAALDLAVVSRCIGTNQLVANAQLGGGFLKQRGQIALAVRKTVGKLEPVVRLDTLHLLSLIHI